MASKMENFVFQIVLLFFGLSTLKGDDTTPGVNKIDIDGLNKLLADKMPYFEETFNNKDVLSNKWVISKAKKDGVEGDLAKYDGDWHIDSPIKHSMPDDYGLVFKQRAKHRAISAFLEKPFEFNNKPFILQYEVTFQEGQECGGGYLKLVSGDKNIDLSNFHDKTPYSIMFGPDKCGSSNKIHFIFRHKNPLNGSYEEKHCKPTTNRFDEVFTDGKPHLFSLTLYPDNTFKILLDHKVINDGSLLLDFNPPVNPPAEVDDPADSKPSDWDDREKIPDPEATKPEDWDEEAPHTIPDLSASKPDNWLDYEPLYIRDPSAEKPHDWDVEMDGEWEAPLVPNPACEDAAGCGEWTPPRINNPAYKGKWSPPLINNPSYKGKWTPTKIPNAHFFEDKHPFRMDKIVAIGFEIWSMSPNIMFDNILITDSEDFADRWAEMTFDLKMKSIEQSSDSFFNQFLGLSNKYPWLWAVYTVVLLILVTVIIYCCFWNVKDSYEHKKTDTPQNDAGDHNSDITEGEALESSEVGNQNEETAEGKTQSTSATSESNVLRRRGSKHTIEGESGSQHITSESSNDEKIKLSGENGVMDSTNEKELQSSTSKPKSSDEGGINI